MAKIKKVEQNDHLVGQWFHSIKDDKLCWQGIVLSSPEPGWYLVETFEWLVGDSLCRRLVHIEDMRDWLFYSNRDWFKFSFEYGAAHGYTRKSEGGR